MGEEALLIVGNGFDLSMGFKTSYDNLIWQLQMLTKHKLTQLLTYNQIEFIDCSMRG